MAEVKPTASAGEPAGEARTATGFELRLERGGAYVQLTDKQVAPGLRLDALVLAVPEVKFPFDVAKGSGQFRHRLCDLVRVEVSAEPDVALAAVQAADLAAAGLEDVQIAFRSGFAELAGRIAAGPAFTLKCGLVSEGEQGLALVFHSPRLYAPAPLAAAGLPRVAARAFSSSGLAPILSAPLPPLLRRVLASRGWKSPRVAGARLTAVEIAPGQARVRWERDRAGPAALPADPDLLAAVEGARTFQEAEAALARGETERAREAYLGAGPAASSHPFAAGSLLSLLCLDERFHDEALDLAAEWIARRPDFVPALAAEAWVRTARGEEARAAAALSALAAAAAGRGEAFSALAAAEAVFELGGADRESIRRAVEAALAMRRDHLPALRALRALASATQDAESLLRANRRLVAYAPADAEKARAHAELGELLLQSDAPAARLHLDQALRLAPDDQAALSALARACEAAGEPLRAVRARDRLRELFLARGDRPAAAAAALEAGALWEERLSHDENALLRYREACELAPGADAHARAARVAERLGHWTEAADHHAAALSALDLSDPEARALAARTHVSLADVAEKRLGDAPGAATHLEAAVGLSPEPGSIRRLADLYRGLGRPGDLLAALDRLTPLAEPAERVGLLAEAGALALELGRHEAARSRLASALSLDERSRPALEALSRLAADRGDAQAERDALTRLLPLAADREEEAALQDRLADACQRAGDLAAAARAVAAARRASPTLSRLAEAVRLARRGGDAAALAGLLAEEASAHRAAGDVSRAAQAWLERGRILAGSDPALALSALAEARALAPGDAAVLRAQAELLERAGDMRLALATLRALLAAAPSDAPLLELRAARAALAAGEDLAAREHAERAVRAAAPGAGELLADVLERSGDDAGRADLLERLGRHAESARAWERAGQPVRARAALEIAAQDPATAQDVLGRLAELRLADGDAPGAAAAFVRLARLRGGREGARLALRAHAVSPSLEALDAAVACDASLVQARAERAFLRADQDARTALADCEAALSGEGLDPSRRPALLRLASRLAARLEDAEAARRHLAAYCAEVSSDDEALAELAGLHREAGAEGDLAFVLNRRLPLAAGSEAVNVRLDLASLLALHPSRATEAARLVREAIALAPSELAPLRAALAGPTGETLAPEERLGLLDRLAAHPAATPAEVSEALAERAHLLARDGDAAGALAAARAAAERGPSSDAGLELLARLSGEAGDAAGAARALLSRAARAAERGDPDAAERLAEAGLAAEAQGLSDEAEPALRRAAGLLVERETLRAVQEALVGIAARRGDGAAEREALLALVPLLPTGARPERLLRASRLSLAAGDPAAARAAAEEARTLAPLDPEAARTAADAARAAGDLAGLADRLGDLARLLPAEAAGLQLERGRLLADLGRLPEADAAFSEALAALPPDRALAEEQVRLRLRGAPGAVSEPLERFALRAPAPDATARALRAAAALALARGEPGPALRCARRAFARTRERPALAGPLLARILYAQGALGEALVLHRAIFAAGFPGIEPEEVVVLCRQLAELAEDSGERDLALAALDRLLELKGQDAAAARRRFDLDPDRPRAVRALAAAGESGRSARNRALLVAHAAAAARLELGDGPLSERLFRRARAEAQRTPPALAEVERVRVDAVRASEGPASDALLAALRDASEASRQAGQGAAARAFLAEAADLARARGLQAEVLRDHRRLEELALEAGERTAAADHAVEAALLLREEKDLAGAVAALQRALERDPSRPDAWALLEETARALGREGASTLAEVLAGRVALAPAGPERVDLLTRLAAAQAMANEREEAVQSLRAALEADPGHLAAEEALLGLLAELGRDAERARLLIARADRSEDDAARAALLREAAATLAASGDPGDLVQAAGAFATLSQENPRDLAAARSAADLLVSLGLREEAIPHLAALVRADPDDEAAAHELASAYAGRHRERAELFLERAGRTEGEARAQRLREAAKALFAAGDDGRARSVLREAFDAWPADDAAFFAAIRDAAADVERLDAVLSARARAVPAEAAGCHRARADALLAFGRVDRAVEAYEACLALDPEDPGALAALAACLAQARGDAAAAEADGRLVALADRRPGLVPEPVEAEPRYRLGLAAWSAGRPADAIAHLERAIALAPGDARADAALAAVARAHASRGEARAALSSARRRADLAAERHLPQERRIAVEAGVDLATELGDGGPDTAALLESLLALRIQAGEHPDALAPLARRAAAALEAAGERDRAHAALAAAGLEAGAPAGVTEPPEAPADLEALEAALEAGPAAAGFDESARTLARFHADRGDYLAAARVHARRAEAAEAPAERSAAWLASADALEKGGAEAEAILAALDLAADADPDEPHGWRMRARLQLRARDGAAAARSWLSVSIRSEGDEAARAALEAARLFEEEGQHAEAARAYRVAVAARPGCVPARRVLAEEALAAGDPGTAADHLAAIPIDDLPPEARPEHERALARALERAGRADRAEAAWTSIFRSEPADSEAFARVSALALTRRGLEAWLELAAQHDAALAAFGDAERRRELRLERGRRFSETGRLEAARGAYLAALEIDPTHQSTLDALADLDGRADDWAAAAGALGAEAAASSDPVEAAALHLRRARILAERLADTPAAVASLREAVALASRSGAPPGQRLVREAEALLADLGAGEAPSPAIEPHAAGEAAADPLAEILRAQAEAAAGPDRATVLERLAGHLERAGDPAGAADALLSALEVDPERELTWSWLLSLAEGDRARLDRAQALRARSGLPPLEPATTEPAPIAAPRGPGEAPAWPADRWSGEEAEPDVSIGLSEFLAEPEAAAGLSELLAGSDVSIGLSEFLAEPDASAESAPPDRAPAAAERPDRGLPEMAAADLGLSEIPEEPAAPEPAPWAPADVEAPAEEGPPDPARVHRELALALEDAGNLPGAFEELLLAQEADPEDGPTAEWLARLADQLGRTADGISFRERAIELDRDAARRADRFVDLSTRAEALGLRETVLRLLERARASNPRNVAALGALAKLFGDARDNDRLIEAARALEESAGAEALVPHSAALGRAHLARGENELAFARLAEALRLDPEDLTVARDLSRAAERTRRWAEYVQYGEVCADAIAAYDPLAAAARYRHFAEILRDRFGDLDRAAQLMEKALSRTPGDPDARRELLALRAARPQDSATALEGYLAAARTDPSDASALARVDELARGLARGVPPDVARRLLERARIAASLAAWAAPGHAPAPAVRLAAAIPLEARERAAAPGANGPLARLLALLTPHLESVFPADLARHGATPEDRVTPPRAPMLRMALEGAGRALGGRPHATFLVSREGLSVATENTRPPAVIASEAVEHLPEGGLHFIAARSVDLLERGWSLVGKFAPRDVGILLELACRFSGGQPAQGGLPPDRAEAFLAALSRTVPPSLRARCVRLGAAATEELAALDPRAFATALRRSANRVALLYAGDPAGALEVLAALEAGAEGPAPARALALPDLRDLALFALSDPFLDLRLAVIG